MSKRDLLSLWDLGAEEIRALFVRAAELKALARTRRAHADSARQDAGDDLRKGLDAYARLVRVGMYELGGHAVYLAAEGSQIGRGEPLRDTAACLVATATGSSSAPSVHDIARSWRALRPCR